MPWDVTSLHVAKLDLDGELPRLHEHQHVAGGDDANVAIVQPEWSPDGRLHSFKADGSVVGARFAGGLEYLDGSGFDTSAHSAFHAIRSDAERLAWVAASFSTGASVIADGHTVAAPRPLDLDEAFFPAPERLNYPTGSTEQVDAGTSRESAYGHSLLDQSRLWGGGRELPR